MAPRNPVVIKAFFKKLEQHFNSHTARKLVRGSVLTVYIETATRLALQDCSLCIEVLHALAYNVSYLSRKKLTVISWEESGAGALTFESTVKVFWRGLMVCVASSS